MNGILRVGDPVRFPWVARVVPAFGRLHRVTALPPGFRHHHGLDKVHKIWNPMLLGIEPDQGRVGFYLSTDRGIGVAFRSIPKQRQHPAKQDHNHHHQHCHPAAGKQRRQGSPRCCDSFTDFYSHRFCQVPRFLGGGFGRGSGRSYCDLRRSYCLHRFLPSDFRCLRGLDCSLGGLLGCFHNTKHT